MNTSGNLAFLRSRHALAWLLRLCDLIGIILTYYIIFGLRNNEFPVELHRSYRFYVVLSVLLLSLYIGDCYRIDRNQPNWTLPLRTALATMTAGLLIGLSVYLFGPELLHGNYNVLARTVLIPSLLVFTGFAVMIRLIAHHAVVRLTGRTRWLVIAHRDGGNLDHFWGSFHRQRSLGDLVVLADGVATGECPIAGTWNDLERMLTERWTGLVLVGGWQMPDVMIEKLMRARLSGLRIYDIGEFYERMWEKLPILHLQNGWFAITSGFALLHERNTARLKRLCDIIMAILMFVGSSPVLLLVYVAVRLDSHGPGFFSQPRVGLNGSVFTCWKFRTMNLGAENGSKYTQFNDSRITRLGRFLRKSRLDEFPQLWNVLRGDMSFIGPRAEWTKCVADYEHVIPFYQLRHLVRPGLTGWAQVNYPYGVSVDDAREKLEYDLYYLKNHSLALDLIILMRTVKVVLFGTGAR